MNEITDMNPPKGIKITVGGLDPAGDPEWDKACNELRLSCQETDFEENHIVVKEWEWQGSMQVELEFDDGTRDSYPKSEYYNWKAKHD